jgi:hypothetical protein
MNEADVHIQNFLTANRALLEQQRQRRKLRQELHRLVMECEVATKAKDAKRARKLLREADRIRAELER